jgi:hypothetical protein
MVLKDEDHLKRKKAKKAKKVKRKDNEKRLS